MARAPGAAVGRQDRRGAPGDPQGLARLLPARRALRRLGPPDASRPGRQSPRRQADVHDPGRQRRSPARPEDPRPRRIRSRRALARHRAGGVDPHPRRDDPRHVRGQSRRLPALLPRRDELQPPGRRVRGLRPVLDGANHRRRRRHLARGAGHGGALRAQLPRVARRLRPDRAQRPVRLLRGLRPHLRVADHPTRQMARRGRQTRLAQAHPEPEHPAVLDVLAQRPQRLLAPGAGAHRQRALPARRGLAGVPPGGREHLGRRGAQLLRVDEPRQPHRPGATGSGTGAPTRAPAARST